MEEERKFIYYTGKCHVGVCTDGAACKQFDNGTYTCVCTHDSRPPSIHGTCNRRIVDQRPVPIPGVQPPNSMVSSTSSSIVNTTPNLDVTSVAAMSSPLIILIGFVSLTMVVMFTLFCVIRKRRRNVTSASPVNLKESLIVMERYAPNPQYSACAGAGVPVLRKETLKFLNEIGEGCFGKVYKGYSSRGREDLSG